MVDFAIFNELSLPLESKSCFTNFFLVLKGLKERGLNKIRMEQEFECYDILPNQNIYQICKDLDRDEQTKIRLFMANKIIIIHTPLVYNDEINDSIVDNIYYLNNEKTFSGLACCDIWNTISVSFNSRDEWNKDSITLQKNNKDIRIRHASLPKHLDEHKCFFNDLEKENKLKITKDNFWQNKEHNFPKTIIFCNEVEKYIKNLDYKVFSSVINILRDVETNKKKITEYNWSGESETVKNNRSMLKKRVCTIDKQDISFDKHIKSLPNGNRLYFLEKDKKVYIGYIGKHLPTKNN